MNDPLDKLSACFVVVLFVEFCRFKINLVLLPCIPCLFMYSIATLCAWPIFSWRNCQERSMFQCYALMLFSLIYLFKRLNLWFLSVLLTKSHSKHGEKLITFIETCNAYDSILLYSIENLTLFVRNLSGNFSIINYQTQQNGYYKWQHILRIF